MKKAVLFDMDGTLVKTEIILEEALSITLKSLDRNDIKYIDNPIEKYNEIMGVPLNVVWRNILSKPSDRHIHMANRWFQNALIYCIGKGKSKMYEGAEDTLGYIKSKGYEIFIASNGDKDYLEALYQNHHMERFVTGVYSINDIETSSKSDLVKHIIQEEQVEPEYIVGDRLPDFIAGKNNDIHVIGCKFYFSKPDELVEADDVIESLVDLKKII